MVTWSRTSGPYAEGCSSCRFYIPADVAASRKSDIFKSTPMTPERRGFYRTWFACISSQHIACIVVTPHLCSSFSMVVALWRPPLSPLSPHMSWVCGYGDYLQAVPHISPPLKELMCWASWQHLNHLWQRVAYLWELCKVHDEYSVVPNTITHRHHTGVWHSDVWCCLNTVNRFAATEVGGAQMEPCKFAHHLPHIQTCLLHEKTAHCFLIDILICIQGY